MPNKLIQKKDLLKMRVMRGRKLPHAECLIKPKLSEIDAWRANNNNGH